MPRHYERPGRARIGRVDQIGAQRIAILAVPRPGLTDAGSGRWYGRMIATKTDLVVEPVELLERSEQFSTMADVLATVVETGRGRLVLVSGEAGIGKTSLVRRFCDQAEGCGRVW